jgi:putative transposase
MPNYRRAFVPRGTFFFNVTLLDRRSRLLVDHINDLRKSFQHIRRSRAFAIDAIVVLPDHLHCIWTLPVGDPDYSTRWRLIKADFARKLPAREPLSTRRRKIGERGVWQRRFWEHAIRDDKDLASHIEYIHNNPVKHGLAERASAWRYSSIHRFIARGDFGSDWAAKPTSLESVGE